MEKPKQIKESEKVLERKLAKWVKDAGGESIKLKSDYHTGLPDRLNLLPNANIFFCEVKSTGQKPTAIQKVVHKMLRSLGFNVYVIDNSLELSEMLKSELLKNQK